MPDETQFYVPGPSYMWLGIGVGQAYRFAGWSESGLTVSIQPTYEDIQVDYAGTSPGDIAILGYEARISAAFSRFNDTVLMQAASFFGASGTPGQAGLNQLGSLMHLEQIGYPLFVFCPYSAKGVFSSMVPGFIFYNAFLNDPHEAAYSIRAKKPNLGWRATPVFGTMSGDTFLPDTPPYNASALYTVNPVIINALAASLTPN